MPQQVAGARTTIPSSSSMLPWRSPMYTTRMAQLKGQQVRRWLGCGSVFGGRPLGLAHNRGAQSFWCARCPAPHCCPHPDCVHPRARAAAAAAHSVCLCVMCVCFVCLHVCACAAGAAGAAAVTASGRRACRSRHVQALRRPLRQRCCLLGGNRGKTPGAGRTTKTTIPTRLLGNVLPQVGWAMAAWL